MRKRRKCFANQISANLESFRRLLQKSVGNIDASLIGLGWIAHQWLQGCVRVNALPKLIYCRATLQPRNHWCEISLSPASGELMFTTHFFRTKLSRFGGIWVLEVFALFTHFEGVLRSKCLEAVVSEQRFEAGGPKQCFEACPRFWFGIRQRLLIAPSLWYMPAFNLIPQAGFGCFV